jgi:antitoxin (DNA-binding transcriptional repressor) of toxin-antitoxin stability system
MRYIHTIGVRQFKKEFSRLLDNDEEIYITSRGEPVAVFTPLLGKRKDLVRIRIAKQLIGLGKSQRGRVSEDHDEVLYP